MSEKSNLTKKLEKLKTPFKIDEVLWKPSHSNSGHIFFVPYIEKGQIIDRFNDCIGAGNWDCVQEHLAGGYMKCTLVARSGGESVSRDGVGLGDAGDLKAAETDSIKRAARIFGLGEFHAKVAWASFETKGDKKIPTDPGSKKALYGNSLNEAIRAYLSGVEINLNDDKVYFIKADRPNNHQQQGQTPVKSSFNVELSKKLIVSAEKVTDFETAYNSFKGQKGVSTSYSILLALWGDQLLAKANHADIDVDTAKAFGKLVIKYLGKENGYVKELAKIVNEKTPQLA